MMISAMMKESPRHMTRFPAGAAGGSSFIGLSLVLLLALVPASASGKSRPSMSMQPRSVSVVAAAAKKGILHVYITGLGTVVPLNTVTVRSRVDGQLMKVDFQEGQIVEAGKLLAQIDPRPFEVQLQQAEGQLARDKSLLDNARLDLSRYKTLIEQDSIARQQLDTQESLVRQYEGTVKIDQANADSARLQLTYCRITAPIAGRIGLRQVDAGNIVRATDTGGLAVITQIRPITVVFSVPEDNIPAILERMSGKETIVTDAYDRDGRKKLANGRLLTIDNQIDPTTGTVKLKARFANDDDSLFPNQFVNVKLLIDTRKDAIIIPQAAVQRGQNGTFVYVIKPDKTATVRPVSLGPSEGDDVSVTEGLQSGEQVVTEGADKLHEGSAVELPAEGGGQGARKAK